MLIKLGKWFLNTETGELYNQKHSAENITKRLDHTPLSLLLCLLKYHGKDVTKDTMLDEVWPNKVVSEDVLSVAISQIRKALGDNARKPMFIKTIPGIGYRLIADVIDVKANNQNKMPIGLFQKNKTILLFIFFLVICSALYFLFKTPSTSVIEELPTLSAKSHYQKGRYLLTLNDLTSWRQAQQIFEDTIISNPNYAPVYLELAKSKYQIMGLESVQNKQRLEEIKFLLNKSLVLAPTQAEVYLLLANTAFTIEWDFTLANRYFEKSIELDPTSAITHFKYAQFLLAAGKFERALSHTQQYIALDPSGYARPSVAWIHNMMQDYDTALLELAKLKQLQPGSFIYHISAQAIFENMGNEAASFTEFMAIFKQLNYSSVELNQVQQAFNQRGLSGVYSWLLNDKKEQQYIGQYLPPLSFARYAIKAGQEELAVQYLLQAAQEKQTELLWFNVDPKYKSIRHRSELANLLNTTVKKTN
ncbi:MAG: winged helix-turn-helix domain-containing protein [Colwellia sp.]|nr:winged helix-turn-helix domain-containing protein [Colwellia sp.]